MSKRTSAFFVDPLYSRMADDLHLGGMSQRTHDGYLRAVRQLSDYCQTPPDEISEDQLRRYFLHLKNEKQFAYGSLRVAYSGIKFFYTRTFKRDWQTLAQMKLQNVKSLPEVITIKQVHQIIDACTTARMAVYFWTVYSLGLRMQEGLNLQVGSLAGKTGGSPAAGASLSGHLYGSRPDRPGAARKSSGRLRRAAGRRGRVDC